MDPPSCVQDLGHGSTLYYTVAVLHERSEPTWESRNMGICKEGGLNDTISFDELSQHTVNNSF